MSGRLRPIAAAVLTSALLPLSGCSNEESATTLTVLAASSLVDAFAVIAEEFEAEHDGVDVELVTGSSTALAEQAADGAPGDVLATADESSMQVAAEAGAVSDDDGFATNVLVLATSSENPGDVAGLSDLSDITWVRCADEVPCGRVAVAVLDAQDIRAEPASLEEDARATLDKLTAGEAEAALVYRTDAIAAGDAVTTIAIPGADDQRTTYFIAPLAQAEDVDLAEAFVDLVLGEVGQDALSEKGFGPP